MKKKNLHIGSSLDEFLKEEGILEETRAAALKERDCMAGAESDEESEDQQGADGASHEHESCGSGPAA